MRHFFWIGMANTEKRENLSLASLRVRLLTQSGHTVISSDGTLEKRKLSNFAFQQFMGTQNKKHFSDPARDS